MDNSTIKSLYPNYIKSKLKKPMNKKYPLRINNFTNENIDINNIVPIIPMIILNLVLYSFGLN